MWIKPRRIIPMEVLKKSVWIIFGIILLYLVMNLMKRNQASINNVWACQDGKWVKVGRPPSAKPPNIPCHKK